MDLLVSNLGIPNGIAGWKVLQKKQPADFKAFAQDPVLKREIAYFREKAPKAESAAALLKDPRLEEVALTAFGLTSQIGMQGLMRKVLASDVEDKNSVASKMVDPRYRSIARAFNYGGAMTPAEPAVASSASVMVKNPGEAFASFSGTFGSVTLNDVDIGGAVTPNEIAARLQAAFQKADGKRTDITVKAVGFKLQFNDARGRGTAEDFSFAPLGTVPTATGASATVTLDNPKDEAFLSFTGRFGDVTVSKVDLSKAASPEQIAVALQAAFRKADGNRADITVAAKGSDLVFTDARGRSLSQSFQFSAKAGGPTAGASAAAVKLGNFASGGFDSFSGRFAAVSVENVDLSSARTPAQAASLLQDAFRKADKDRTSISVTAQGDTLLFKDAQGGASTQSFNFAAAGSGTTAAAPTNLVAGSEAVAQQGGPAVASKDFLDQVIQLYTQAKFEQVVGDTASGALRQTLYAKRQLPKITNWYSVISDRPLATVVQTVLGLPETFVKLDVDRQVQMLKSKMDIKDFTDPAKLDRLLNRFVSISTAQGTDAPTGTTAASLSPALTALSYSTGLPTSSSSLSGASLAALLLST